MRLALPYPCLFGLPSRRALPPNTQDRRPRSQQKRKKEVSNVAFHLAGSGVNDERSSPYNFTSDIKTFEGYTCHL